MSLEEEFSVEYLIEKYGIAAVDNYDSNVSIFHELKMTNEHSHEILLKSIDSSLNVSMITLYVDIEDHVAPIVGEIILSL